MKSKKIFDFLKRVQLDFDLSKYLGKLLMIDSSQAVDYILQRYGRMQQLKIVDKCVQILSNQKKGEREEFQLHLLLDEIFVKNKELSRDFHAI